MPAPKKINIFWFRRDLRLHDNRGLFHALKGGLPVLPLFIFDSATLQNPENKNDSRVTFIYDEVLSLHLQLRKYGSLMLVKKGMVTEVFKELINEYTVENVFANHDYEPTAKIRDSQVKELLRAQGTGFRTFKDQVIFEKDEILSNAGEPYKVFTPYSRKWKEELINSKEATASLLPETHHFLQLNDAPPPLTLEMLSFARGSQKIPSREIPDRLLTFYDTTRDFPHQEGTSRLGIHLRHGTISIRELVRKAAAQNKVFLNELIWREFYMMILHHNPHVVQNAYNAKYDRIPWVNNEEHFLKWCEGKTGIPLVDAGMRQLNQTGFMHNRLRMITASFLTKNLLTDWRRGEAYFAQKLLDNELASNNGGWQWAAGSGTDAQPYFRVFNPDSQAKNFDPEFKYIKKWVPEYGTPAYPAPVTDLKISRRNAIAHFKKHLNG